MRQFSKLCSLNQSVLCSSRVWSGLSWQRVCLNLCSLTTFSRATQIYTNSDSGQKSLRFHQGQKYYQELCYYCSLLISQIADSLFHQMNLKPDTDHSMKCSLDYYSGHQRRTGCTRNLASRDLGLINFKLNVKRKTGSSTWKWNYHFQFQKMQFTLLGNSWTWM